MYRTIYPNELWHYGIMGQKWGIRRYQYSDGSLTPEGKKRYGSVSDLNAAKPKRNRVEKHFERIEKYSMVGLDRAKMKGNTVAQQKFEDYLKKIGRQADTYYGLSPEQQKSIARGYNWITIAPAVTLGYIGVAGGQAAGQVYLDKKLG